MKKSAFFKNLEAEVNQGHAKVVEEIDEMLRKLEDKIVLEFCQAMAYYVRYEIMKKAIANDYETKKKKKYIKFRWDNPSFHLVINLDKHDHGFRDKVFIDENKAKLVLKDESYDSAYVRASKYNEDLFSIMRKVNELDPEIRKETAYNRYIREGDWSWTLDYDPVSLEYLKCEDYKLTLADNMKNLLTELRSCLEKDGIKLVSYNYVPYDGKFKIRTFESFDEVFKTRETSFFKTMGVQPYSSQNYYKPYGKNLEFIVEIE